jgi:hypothetical protein
LQTTPSIAVAKTPQIRVIKPSQPPQSTPITITAAEATPTSHQAKRGPSLGQARVLKRPPTSVRPKAFPTKLVGDITDWENQVSMYSGEQVPHYHTWIILPEGWTQQWVEGAQLPKRVLSKYHASLTSIAATRGKRVAQPSSSIVVDSDEERMVDDYAEDEHDDDEEEEVIEEPEDEDDKDFIVPDEDMEEEEEAEEAEEVQEGEEEDAPALSISDGGEIEEDYEPTPAGKAGTSGGYKLKN